MKKAVFFGAGVLVDMVTPMAPDGELDLGGAVRLSRRLAAAGVDGLVLTAEAGEGEALDADERLTLWETVAAAVGDALPIWAGLWGTNERAASRLGRAAEQLGVAGLALPLGSAGGPAAGRVRQALAAAETGTATILGLVPVGKALAAGDLQTLHARLGERLLVAPDAAALAPALCDSDGRLCVLAREATDAVAAAALGGVGVVSAAANLAPGLVVALWRAASQGDRAAAWAALSHLWPLLSALAAAPQATVLKFPCRSQAVPGPALRLPLEPLQGPRAAAVERALERLGSSDGGTAAG